jgi:heterodisulfide reductase subunit A
MSKVTLGVFICDCGEQIASALDVGALQTAVRALPEVALVRRLPYACSPDGLESIQKAIAEHGLHRVVVAGCTPRTMEPRFRAACQQAGLQAERFLLVDIREGCAWVHQAEPRAATVKALDLIRMGVARAALCEAIQPITARVVPGALVIGGGLAGLTSALTLANEGVPVTLVEREPRLGGMLCEAHTLYPDRRNASEFLAQKVTAVTHNPRINVLLQSQVTSVSGTVGCYSVKVNGRERQQSAEAPVDVGAIIVATGARALPPQGLFGYDGKRVVSQLEFERELRYMEGGSSSGCAPCDVVMILCAGQRNQAVPHCSGLCCVVALKQAMELRTRNPQAKVTIVFRNLYLLGRDDYDTEPVKARQAGVGFLRYTPSSPPVVTDEAVEVYDELTATRHRLRYDRVVLATPLLPQPDSGAVAHMLNIAQDGNGFFPEVRYRLRPQNHAERGIYVCGAAHRPTDWITAEFQAISAAFKAVRYLQAGTVTSRAPVAVVNEDLCTGCGTCVETCPFGAISMRKGEGVMDLSEVDRLLCKGCGNCVVACPVKAITLPLCSDQQVLAQIDAALAKGSRHGTPRILVFGCQWSSHAAAELAGARKLGYPVEVRLIQMQCSARFDPLHVLWALFNGADGVFLGACPPGDCHYVNGNRFAQERFSTLRGLLGDAGFDPRRLRLEWITPEDAHDFVGKVTGFVELIRALRASPLRIH